MNEAWENMMRYGNFQNRTLFVISCVIGTENFEQNCWIKQRYIGKFQHLPQAFQIHYVTIFGTRANTSKLILSFFQPLISFDRVIKCPHSVIGPCLVSFPIEAGLSGTYTANIHQLSLVRFDVESSLIGLMKQNTKIYTF